MVWEECRVTLVGQTQPQSDAQECTTAQPEDEVNPAKGAPNKGVSTVAHLAATWILKDKFRCEWVN